MVEMAEQHRSLSKLRLQDSVLQVLKRLERLFYLRRYAALSTESKEFFESRKPYDTYPALSDTSSILIFKPDDIGDAVYALPGLRSLRTAFPKAKLYLLCQEKTKALYERANLFDQIVGVPVRTRWLRFQFLDLHSALDHFPVERFDIAIFLRNYPAYFRYFCRVPAVHRVIPKDPRLSLKTSFQAYVTSLAHQSVQMTQILQRVSPSVAPHEYFPSMAWREEDRRVMEKVFGNKVPERFLVIHPYARFETRRWPQSYWVELMALLRKVIPVPVVVVGGKEDPALDIPGTISTNGRLSLTETGYLSSRALAFIGVESGPAHWASAMGVPTVMIMGGHSHLSEWGPIGNSWVIRKDVSCENCYLRVCAKEKLRCLTAMTPEWALAQLTPFLKSKGVLEC